MQEIPRPEPGPGEVRVRVAVSGVNPTDWKQRRGCSRSRSTARARRTRMAPARSTPSAQASTRRASASVSGSTSRSRSALGDRRRSGRSCRRSARCALPDEASFELGASLGVPALTAYHCLFADGPLRRLRRPRRRRGRRRRPRRDRARTPRRRARDRDRLERREARARAGRRRRRSSSTTAPTTPPSRSAPAAPDGVRRVVEVALPANLELDLAVCRRNAVVVVYADTGAGDARGSCAAADDRQRHAALRAAVRDRTGEHRRGRRRRQRGARGRRADDAAAAPLRARPDRRRARRRRGTAPSARSSSTSPRGSGGCQLSALLGLRRRPIARTVEEPDAQQRGDERRDHGERRPDHERDVVAADERVCDAAAAGAKSCRCARRRRSPGPRDRARRPS